MSDSQIIRMIAKIVASTIVGLIIGFDPRLAVDDRDRVVKMWRDAGLTCFQVADGNF